MIRTRDFILYLCILVFVVLAATYTGLTSKTYAVLPPVFVGGQPSEAVTLSAAAVDDTIDRPSLIASLREKLTAGEGVRTDAPPEVNTFVDQATSSSDEVVLVDTETVTATVEGAPRRVQYCNGSAAPAGVSGLGIDVLETDGALRKLYRTTANTGSTTASSSPARTLVTTMPARSARLATDTCLPDTLVGVYQAGAKWYPLTNEMARSFVNIPATGLVGYTRDGFALYGPADDESQLDGCGGILVGGVYQYHIRRDDLFILGCYAHTPVSVRL